MARQAWGMHGDRHSPCPEKVTLTTPNPSSNSSMAVPCSIPILLHLGSLIWETVGAERMASARGTSHQHITATLEMLWSKAVHQGQGRSLGYRDIHCHLVFLQSKASEGCQRLWACKENHGETWQMEGKAHSAPLKVPLSALSDRDNWWPLWCGKTRLAPGKSARAEKEPGVLLSPLLCSAVTGWGGMGQLCDT